jgi:uncharacterized delta-60 repeat protein
MVITYNGLNRGAIQLTISGIKYILNFGDVQIVDDSLYSQIVPIIQDVSASLQFQFGVGAAPSPYADFTAVALVNGQSEWVDIPGFFVDNTLCKSFMSDVYIARRYSGVPSTEDNIFFLGMGSIEGGFNDVVRASAVQSNQQILVGGDFGFFRSAVNPFLVRLNTDGTPDLAFNANVLTTLTNNVNCIVVQPDQKILVGGAFQYGSNLNTLIRLNSDGTVDTSFVNALGANINNGQVWSICMDTTNVGKILVGGNFTSPTNRFCRLNSDGSLDTGFNGNLGTGFDNTVYAIAMGGDGITVGGAFLNYNGSSRKYLVSFNDGGNEDSSWYTALGTSFNGQVECITPQNVGLTENILVGGNFTTFNNNPRLCLVRLNTDEGTVVEDTTFYTNLGTGLTSLFSPAEVKCITLTSSNEIFVGGNFTTFNGNQRGSIIKLNADGTEDSEFYTTIGTGSYGGDIYCITEQANSAVLLGGDFIIFNALVRNRLLRLTDDLPLTELMIVGQFDGLYRPSVSEWFIAPVDGFGDLDDLGVNIQMLSSGQVQYQTTDLPGTELESVIRFRIQPL